MRTFVAIAIICLAVVSTDGADNAPEVEFASSMDESMELLSYENLIQQAKSGARAKAHLARDKAKVKADKAKLAKLGAKVPKSKKKASHHKGNKFKPTKMKASKKIVSVGAGKKAAHKMLKSMKHRLKRWKKRAGKAKGKKKFTAAQIRQAKRAAHAADAAHTAEIVSEHVAGQATKEENHLKGVTMEIWNKYKKKHPKAKWGHPGLKKMLKAKAKLAKKGAKAAKKAMKKMKKASKKKLAELITGNGIKAAKAKEKKDEQKVARDALKVRLARHRALVKADEKKLGKKHLVHHMMHHLVKTHLKASKKIATAHVSVAQKGMIKSLKHRLKRWQRVLH